METEKKKKKKKKKKGAVKPVIGSSLNVNQTVWVGYYLGEHAVLRTSTKSYLDSLFRMFTTNKREREKNKQTNKKTDLSRNQSVTKLIITFTFLYILK